MSVDDQVVPPRTGRSDAAGRILLQARANCAPTLTRALVRLPEPLKLMATYHFGRCDARGRPTAGDAGKMFRAALVTATASALGPTPIAADYAVAVELVHNFTLIHDDILDGDIERRGRPTVWAVWGKPSAILLGDALHALAIEILTDPHQGKPTGRTTEAVARIEQAVIEMCRGQFEDCDFVERRPVATEDYAAMATGKTGALAGCACALGSVAANADPATVTALDLFGRRVGVAFQMIDDLIGIWGNPAKSGKPTSDVAQRRMTMPVVAAIASGTEAGAELAALYEPTSKNTDGDSVARIIGLIESAGGRAWTIREAEHWMNSAIEGLPDGPSFHDLAELARSAIRRDR